MCRRNSGGGTHGADSLGTRLGGGILVLMGGGAEKSFPFPLLGLQFLSLFALLVLLPLPLGGIWLWWWCGGKGGGGRPLGGPSTPPLSPLYPSKKFLKMVRNCSLGRLPSWLIRCSSDGAFEEEDDPLFPLVASPFGGEPFVPLPPDAAAIHECCC